MVTYLERIVQCVLIVRLGSPNACVNTQLEVFNRQTLEDKKLVFL